MSRRSGTRRIAGCGDTDLHEGRCSVGSSTRRLKAGKYAGEVRLCTCLHAAFETLDEYTGQPRSESTPQFSVALLASRRAALVRSYLSTLFDQLAPTDRRDG